MSKRKSRQLPKMPDGLTPSERALYEAANKMLQIRQGSTPIEITALEAVIQKQMATALAGSPHAQRQFLENVKALEARRAELIAEECARWRLVKADHRRQLDAHVAEFGYEPLLFPHPDDIEIDRRHGVRINGPMDLEGHRLETQLGNLVIAHLHQDALDRARTKRRGGADVIKGDPFMLALWCNNMLSPRFQYAQADLISLRMLLAHVSIRELLKLTYEAFKKAGRPRPRDAYADPPHRVAALMSVASDLAKLTTQVDADDPELNAEIMAILRDRFGKADAA